MTTHRMIHGDCLDVLPTLEAGSVDCVITDPPYPHIKRPYGYWTEAQWFALMDPVVEECRRVLKPTGSAVFVLQPNSERLGRMRTWLWRFMLQWGGRWGIVQDAYWWNTAAIPEAHSIQGRLMRPSVKACVWLGPHDCYRDQDSVLWAESECNAADRGGRRAAGRAARPSGHGCDNRRASQAAVRRGGVSPFNVYPTSHGNGGAASHAGSHGHGAGTPLTLCRWWTRYICPPGGTVLDPFAGSGTTGVACKMEGRSYVGIERIPEYARIARERIASTEATTLPPGLFAEAL